MIDFPALAAQLLSRSEELVTGWFPAGKRQGHEWKIGNLRGDPGESMSINLSTGMWGDFSSGEKGGDLISLYAAREGFSQLDAARALSNGHLQESLRTPSRRQPDSEPPAQSVPPSDIFERPPEGQNFHGAHKRHGAPSTIYTYRDTEGVLYHVCRYDPKPQAGEEPQKVIVPWRWINGSWVARHVPKPRPLYNLDRLAALPDAPVLLVEGEKCVEAGQRILRETVLSTWSGGSAHAGHADWGPLAGRRVNIWPDADEPGWEVAGKIAGWLLQLECTVGIIDTHGQPQGWDLADAIQEGWDREAILRYAREHKRPITRPAVPLRVKTPLHVEHKPADAPDVSADEVVDTAPAPPPDDDDDTAAAGHFAMWRQYGLACDGNGRPHINVDNVIRVISEHPGTWSHVWYDEFLQKIMSRVDGDRVREWGDVDTLKLMLWFQRALGFAKLGADTVYNAVIIYAHSKRRNEAREWLRGLVWDGVERLPELIARGFGAPQNDYARAVGRCFLMGAAQRILKPGCKLDNMPVFEGEEGLYKSTALEILGGPYYAQTHEKVGDKDFYMALTGKMIIELTEMHSFSGVEQNRIKGVISTATDRYRAPYGRLSADHARMSVFAGTTNEDDWNHSTTGARRFWPVACGTIDLAWLREHREQLFAESVARLDRGELWYDVNAAAARQEQALRQPGDALEEVLLPYLQRQRDVTMAHIFSLLGIEERDRWTTAVQLRISSVLRRAGFIPYRPRVEGVQVRAWRRRHPVEGGPAPADDPTPPQPPLANW